MIHTPHYLKPIKPPQPMITHSRLKEPQRLERKPKREKKKKNTKEIFFVSAFFSWYCIWTFSYLLSFLFILPFSLPIQTRDSSIDCCDLITALCLNRAFCNCFFFLGLEREMSEKAVVIRPFDPERDCLGVEMVERKCEVGTSGSPLDQRAVWVQVANRKSYGELFQRFIFGCFVLQISHGKLYSST